MSAAQIGLFDQPQPSAGAARRTDPETSKEAAESINAGTLEDQVFRYMLNHGPTILDDVVRDLKIDKETASPRFARLQDAGFIELTGIKRPGKKGRPQQEWRVAPHAHN
jgi:predicted ArsR family transcriptional regulator